MGISNMEDSPWKAWKMNPRINPRSSDEMVRPAKCGCYVATYSYSMHLSQIHATSVPLFIT